MSRTKNWSAVKVSRRFNSNSKSQMVTSQLSQVTKSKKLASILSAAKAISARIPSFDIQYFARKEQEDKTVLKTEHLKIGKEQVAVQKLDKDEKKQTEDVSSFQYYFGDVVNSLWKNKENDPQDTVPKWKRKAKVIISKESIDARTRHLAHSLASVRQAEAKLVSLDEFCQHLFTYPQAKWLAVREGAISNLLRIREFSSDPAVQSQVREALSLVGYVDQPQAPGLRILSLDGGGTRGLLMIRILERIEKITGRPTHQNFDYICGVSTGAILAILLGIHKKSLTECDYLYRKMSRQVFNRSRSDAITSLVKSHAYYDTQLWEKTLQEALGEQPMIKSTRDPDCLKVGIVSSVVNQDKARPYLFRSYNLPLRNQSQYQGSSRHRPWEAARATSAAPGYFGEFALEDNIHQDGGLLTNNPTSIGIHESRNLWPHSRIHCVVSLGTGRNQPLSTMEGNDLTMTSLRQKLFKVIDSATDTERVHNILHDLLPPRSYFRFNPYLSQVYGLDETNPERLDSMLRDVDMYIRKNEMKLVKAGERLGKEREITQKALDWLEIQRLIYQPEFLKHWF